MSTIYATMTVYDDSDNEIILDIQGYYNPTQNGGWDEPSWSAFIDDIQAFYVDGTKYKLSRLELQMAEEALWDAMDIEADYEADFDDYWREEESIRKAEMEYENRMYR